MVNHQYHLTTLDTHAGRLEIEATLERAT